MFCFVWITWIVIGMGGLKGEREKKKEWLYSLMPRTLTQKKEHPSPCHCSNKLYYWIASTGQIEKEPPQNSPGVRATLLQYGWPLHSLAILWLARKFPPQKNIVCPKAFGKFMSNLQIALGQLKFFLQISYLSKKFCPALAGREKVRTIVSAQYTIFPMVA